MNAAGKLSVFGLALGLVFGGGWAIGHIAGPLDASAESEPAEHAELTEPTELTEPAELAEAAEVAEPAGVDAAPPGLAAVQNGYALVPETGQLDAGTAGEYRFRITDGAGSAVTRFEIEHDKLLHLIVVRRDGAHFRHVHPELAADGTWSVPLTPPAAGVYRVFADFLPEGGPKTILAADLQVPGDFRPVSEQAGEHRTATVADYQVRLDGNLTAGTSSTVHAVVTRNGLPVTDLQPYLDAYGHLVALRGGDLAYLHVHPEGEPGDGHTPAGPRVTFAIEVPTPGRYRLYLDFQHGDRVHTAEFVVDARPGASAPPTPAGGEPSEPSEQGVPGQGEHGHGG